MRYGIIYRAKNNVNGKVYIGQTTKTLNERRKIHENDKFSCAYFHNALKKYSNNFEWSILCEVLHPSASFLDLCEESFIRYYNSTDPDKGYNLIIGRIKPKSTLSESLNWVNYRENLKSKNKPRKINLKARSETIQRNKLRWLNMTQDEEESAIRRMNTPEAKLKKSIAMKARHRDQQYNSFKLNPNPNPNLHIARANKLIKQYEIDRSFLIKIPVSDISYVYQNCGIERIHLVLNSKYKINVSRYGVTKFIKEELRLPHPTYGGNNRKKPEWKAYLKEFCPDLVW